MTKKSTNLILRDAKASFAYARDSWQALRVKPVTEEERHFVKARIDQRDVSVARLCLFVALAYHLMSLVTDRFVVSPEDFDIFMTIHLTFLTFHTAWWLKLRHTNVSVKHFLWILQVGFIASMGYILWRTTSRTTLADTVLASSGLLMTSSIMLIMCPFAGRMMLLTAGIYVAVAAVGFSQHPLGERWIFIDVLVIGAIAAAQHHGARRLRAQALQEYRTLRRVAPAQIVRQAVTEDKSVEASFLPQLRSVACVSTDWRDYQKFSRSQEPDVVARTLSEYYALCNSILNGVAPQGNYYSDWIADELFVVFFGRWGAPSRPLAMQALEFSRQLVVAKTAFLAGHAMPQAIDLGIAVGTAFVGMMGPKDHHKATALGETPGISRRLQCAGRLLRNRLGEGDRIIVDSNVVAWLKKTETFSTYAIGDTDRLRDLQDKQLHFLEVGVRPGDFTQTTRKESA